MASHRGRVPGRWGAWHARRGRVAGAFSRAIIDSNAIVEAMASITIRRLEESTKERLRIRASRHGRSMEEEAREILRAALTTHGTGGRGLATAIRGRMAKVGGVDLPEIPREPMREPPRFDR